MFGVQVSIEDDGRLGIIEETVGDLQEWVNGVTEDAVQQSIAPALLPEVQAEPTSVARPFQWASARQRRYVMAMIRKGAISGTRTHTLSQGWALYAVSAPDGATAILENPVSYYPYVEGVQQQPGHEASGWLYVPGKVGDWMDTATAMILGSVAIAWGNLTQDQ